MVSAPRLIHPTSKIALPVLMCSFPGPRGLKPRGHLLSHVRIYL